MAHWFRHLRRSYVAAFHDTLMAAFSFVLTLYIRLGGEYFYEAKPYLLPGTVLFTLICITIFTGLKLYRGIWRYASVQDLIAITKAVTLSVLIFLPTMFLYNRLEGFPRSAFFINWLVLIALLGGPRFLYRMIKDRRFPEMGGSLKKEKRIDVILIGLNDQAELFIRESNRRGSSHYKVVGLLDSDKARFGRHMQGVRVYGDYTVLPRVVEKIKKKGFHPQKVIITTDQLDKQTVRELFEQADALGLTLARLPRLTEFKQGMSDSLEIKPIALEDLLGRPQAALDREAMRQLVTGKRVLITGAGGTIGSELSRQIAAYAPSQLTLLDASEYNLYRIDKELEEQQPELPRTSLLCDVRNKAALEKAFEETKPALVFHAAALKHVPLVEMNAVEGVLTNVIGSKNVADVCVAYEVELMVMVSTDKAVNPTNIMGATKRLAERYIQSLAQQKKVKTGFATVRFGNVLGSSGSVIPLFQRQLAAGGPITVTHPDVVRFFMTVREAVELVLQAAVLGMARKGAHDGGLFVLEMGEPVRIADLAAQMIRMAGLRPDVDIKISYTGLRPGEKLFEELFYASEHPHKTEHASIMLATPDEVKSALLTKALDALAEAATKRDTTRVLSLLMKQVPEYEAEGGGERVFSPANS